jgi:hypothetical protein
LARADGDISVAQEEIGLWTTLIGGDVGEILIILHNKYILLPSLFSAATFDPTNHYLLFTCYFHI